MFLCGVGSKAPCACHKPPTRLNVTVTRCFLPKLINRVFSYPISVVIVRPLLLCPARWRSANGYRSDHAIMLESLPQSSPNCTDDSRLSSTQITACFLQLAFVVRTTHNWQQRSTRASVVIFLSFAFIVLLLALSLVLPNYNSYRA